MSFFVRLQGKFDIDHSCECRRPLTLVGFIVGASNCPGGRNMNWYLIRPHWYDIRRARVFWSTGFAPHPSFLHPRVFVFLRTIFARLSWSNQESHRHSSDRYPLPDLTVPRFEPMFDQICEHRLKTRRFYEACISPKANFRKRPPRSPWVIHIKATWTCFDIVRCLTAPKSTQWICDRSAWVFFCFSQLLRVGLHPARLKTVHQKLPFPSPAPAPPGMPISKH